LVVSQSGRRPARTGARRRTASRPRTACRWKSHRIADQIIQDNNARDAQVWSARFEFPNGKASEAIDSFTKERATAHIDGASAQVVVEFNPVLTKPIAVRAVALGGILCERRPKLG
jgi:hypothetical protein